MTMPEEPVKELTYEEKIAKLDEILTRLDDSETPIDKLADDVKEALSWLAPERAHGLPEEILERIFASFCLGK